MEVDLKLDRVSKKYVLRREVDSAPSGHPWLLTVKNLRRRTQDFWALRDVSFEVKRGETLGVIGHNGAGKSTILKLLSNITTPTAGQITIHGRLSALIEVGSGFHPELTGRENIYLSGSILGMRRAEITKKLHSIADFADVRDFLDVPVKRFSSGMAVRLGFSIAAHLNPDILLLDEVLAVGDAAFQEKCLERIAELKRSGITIVFISHDLGAVERICDRVLLLRLGEVTFSGDPRSVVSEYQSHAVSSTLNVNPNWIASEKAEVLRLSFHGESGRQARGYRTGEVLKARVEFAIYEPISDAVFEIIFSNPDHQVVFEFSTEPSGTRIALEPGTGLLEFVCPEVGLLSGLYYADVGVKERKAPEAIHWLYQAATLRIDPGKVVRGQFYLPHYWNLIQDGAAPEDIERITIDSAF
ncbi:MAG: ABC transporter ATP-binding protein [Pyrinomonadaceae bacterium]